MTDQTTSPRALVEQIALYLGRPWKFNTLEPSDWRFEIIDGLGRCLYFRVDGTRFKIRGHFPQNKTSAYRQDYKTIGVSMHRPAKDIAADISRRLLPHYLEAYDQATARHKQEKAQEERLLLIAHAIKKVSGGWIADHNRSNHTVYFESGEAQICYKEEIDLKLRNLSVEQTIRVISILKET